VLNKSSPKFKTERYFENLYDDASLENLNFPAIPVTDFALRAKKQEGNKKLTRVRLYS
jgi:hypothetical protein